ncbi:hypothetical protein DM867_05955 [Halosegnis rubeus]|uniref:Uncharacterized protein n=1 Tax=Halosegnis rubeus TaxID=2212850 RepID=A0A5N5U8B4_9EURY|nr:hypothetical protein [Halosegnis rubeus]KAB7514659.1 hypothetical protein DM867_05955 [Halosegnis rubeus]
MTDEDALRERVSELEATVDALAQRLDTAMNRDIPLLKGTVRAIVDADIDEIGELPDAGRSFHRTVVTQTERLATVEEQVAAFGDVDAAKTTKAQKLAAICAFAQNKHNSQSSTVAVTAAEIRGCVGVSRRYAYELIDDAAAELAGARVRNAASGESSGASKKKALLVDCEQVHVEGGGVNQFTTGDGGGEGERVEVTTTERE